MSDNENLFHLAKFQEEGDRVCSLPNADAACSIPKTLPFTAGWNDPPFILMETTERPQNRRTYSRIGFPLGLAQKTKPGKSEKPALTRSMPILAACSAAARGTPPLQRPSTFSFAKETVVTSRTPKQESCNLLVKESTTPTQHESCTSYPQSSYLQPQQGPSTTLHQKSSTQECCSPSQPQKGSRIPPEFILPKSTTDEYRDLCSSDARLSLIIDSINEILSGLTDANNVRQYMQEITLNWNARSCNKDMQQHMINFARELRNGCLEEAIEVAKLLARDPDAAWFTMFTRTLINAIKENPSAAIQKKNKRDQ